MIQFFAKRGIRSKHQTSLPTPPTDHRHLIPKSDGWYDVDPAGVARLLTTKSTVSVNRTSSTTTSGTTELTIDTTGTFVADGLMEVEVTWSAYNMVKTVNTDSFFLRLYDGAVLIRELFIPASSGTSVGTVPISKVLTPSAGNHTFSVRVVRNSGTGTMTVEATSSTRSADLVVKRVS